MSISIILVRPLFSGNLGSVARAMKNMGLKDLRLVEPVADLEDLEARKMAANAKDVLGRAKTFRDLKSALKGFDLVAGTSRRKGKERANWMGPRDFAEWSRSLPKRHKTAILFGSEDSGLLNDDIALCQKKIMIPSHPAQPSLNLAQAVMVVAYELFVAHSRPEHLSEGTPEKKSAKIEHLEAMYTDLHDLLWEVGFLNKSNPKHLMRLLRNLFSRAHTTEKEVRIFRGICRQVRWWKGQDS